MGHIKFEKSERNPWNCKESYCGFLGNGVRVNLVKLAMCWAVVFYSPKGKQMKSLTIMFNKDKDFQSKKECINAVQEMDHLFIKQMGISIEELDN